VSTFTENILKKKWKYLRDQFSVELGKIPPSRSGDSGAQEASGSKWQFFSQLLFLRDIVKPRSSSGNLSQDTSFLTDSAVLESTTTGTEDATQQNEATGTPVLSLLTDIHNENRPRNKRPRKDDFLEIEREKLRYLQEKATSRKEREEDDDLCFFKSLLPSVKRIPDSMKLHFRSQINSVVQQYAYPTGLHGSFSASLND